MRNRRNRLLSFGAFAVLLVGGVLLLAGWLNRPGTVSWVNYGRIQPGMTVEEVERLLGGTGYEVTVKNGLPQVVDDDVPLDHPKRIKPVVSGERCLSWGDAGTERQIVISLRIGVVVEKWFRERSL